MSDEIKILQPWEEIEGVLQKIDIDKDNGIFVLYFINIMVRLPFNLSLMHELERRIGQRIYLLRTDLEKKPYLLMEGNKVIQSKKSL